MYLLNLLSVFFLFFLGYICYNIVINWTYQFHFFCQIQWLHDKRQLTDENIQNLWTDISLHLLHILQQYGKGYLTAVNANRWKEYVVAKAGYFNKLTHCYGIN